ncbi:hypothetical protein PTKIN_Ptkin19aG0026400 [Pterospermum kingtungense]
MKTTLVKAWQILVELDVREVGERRFIFKFGFEMEKAKIHGLPVCFMTEKIGVVGEKIWEVLTVESDDQKRAWGKWMKV